MIIGVLLGNVQEFTPWIFMGTAGIFMYVALVDMIPGNSKFPARIVLNPIRDLCFYRTQLWSRTSLHFSRAA